MKAILIPCLLTCLCLIPEKGIALELRDRLPLFGVVKEKAATVFASPEQASQKRGEIPAHALLGIDEVKVVRGKQWYRIYQLVQIPYGDLPESNSAWIIASALTPKNRGYVVIDKQPACAYVISSKVGKKGAVCEVVRHVALNKDSEVIGVQSEWIPRKGLRGESQFGASYAEGYCTMGGRIEDYLAKLTAQKQERIKAGSRVGSSNCSILWPKNTDVSIEADGGVRVAQSIPLDYLSGSDERDEPEFQHERNLFNATFNSAASLKEALERAFPDAEKDRLINDFHYDPKTEWFAGTKKGELVEPIDYFGKKAQLITLGCEGAGVTYTFYKQDGKVVMVKRGFDHNPPLDPKTRQPIQGNWELSNETEMMRSLMLSLKVR